MKPSEPPAREESRPVPVRDKGPTVPPYLDDEKVELVSWDEPLVPRE